MGHRHLRGLRELWDIGFSSVELVAVGDPVEENANSLADHAEETLGARPTVVTTRGELLNHGIQVIDIISTPRTHHVIAVEALRSGINVLVEKPLSLTVAEDHRRDPICRLVCGGTYESMTGYS